MVGRNHGGEDLRADTSARAAEGRESDPGEAESASRSHRGAHDGRRRAAPIKPFDRVGDYLAQAGSDARNGQLIDASILLGPIPHDSREENQRIEPGEVPEDWGHRHEALLQTAAPDRVPLRSRP